MINNHYSKVIIIIIHNINNLYYYKNNINKNIYSMLGTTLPGFRSCNPPMAKAE